MGRAEEELAELLGGVELGSLATVDEDALAALAAAFRTTRDQQLEDLDRAIDDSLRMVPRLARPAVRRILGV